MQTIFSNIPSEMWEVVFENCKLLIETSKDSDIKYYTNKAMSDYRHSILRFPDRSKEENKRFLEERKKDSVRSYANYKCGLLMSVPVLESAEEYDHFFKCAINLCKGLTPDEKTEILEVCKKYPEIPLECFILNKAKILDRSYVKENFIIRFYLSEITSENFKHAAQDDIDQFEETSDKISTAKAWWILANIKNDNPQWEANVIRNLKSEVISYQKLENVALDIAKIYTQVLNTVEESIKLEALFWVHSVYGSTKQKAEFAKMWSEIIQYLPTKVARAAKAASLWESITVQ